VDAHQIRLLGTMFNSPGFCDEETYLYLATELHPGTPARHGVEERTWRWWSWPWPEFDRPGDDGGARRRPDHPGPAAGPPGPGGLTTALSPDDQDDVEPRR
jgi:hypothetical protein